MNRSWIAPGILLIAFAILAPVYGRIVIQSDGLTYYPVPTPGTILLLHKGKYDGPLTITKSGEKDKPIIFRATEQWFIAMDKPFNGGPALRELTFHQRAGLLKQLGLRLMADKDELYALSARTGATQRDSMVDIGILDPLTYISGVHRGLPYRAIAVAWPR